MKIEYKEIKDANTIQITTTDERWYLHPEYKQWIPSSTWICSYVPSKELAVWMAKKGWDEAELIKQEAGSKGSRVHKGIEVLISGGEVKHNECFTDGNGDFKELSVEEYEAIISFKAWCDEVNPKFVASENTVFNTELNYAGTLDCLAEINNELYLIDFKTSAEIYPSHKYQISSYLHCDSIKKLHNVKLAVLQVGYKRNKKKFKFTEIEDEFDGFLAAKVFWAKENLNKQPLQKDLPTTIKLGA